MRILLIKPGMIVKAHGIGWPIHGATALLEVERISQIRSSWNGVGNGPGGCFIGRPVGLVRYVLGSAHGIPWSTTLIPWRRIRAVLDGESWYKVDGTGTDLIPKAVHSIEPQSLAVMVRESEDLPE